MDYSSLPRKIKELSSGWARFCLEVEKSGTKSCGKKFSEYTNIVAVSGGADSTALLLISELLARKSGGRVICASVDHGLRAESAEEVDFVAALCSELDITFRLLRTDAAEFARLNGIGIEEAGRKLRYDFFSGLREEFNAEFLLTAHHQGDLSEDIIMRMLRGTGWPALGGMPAYDSGRKLLRPLLNCSKKELINFLVEHGCEWREDKSNTDLNYTRNRIRNCILPLLIEENPNLESGLHRLHEQAELDADFFKSEIEKLVAGLESSGREIIVPKRTIANLHPALLCRFFKKILDNLGPGQALYESINMLVKAVAEKKTGKIFQFPGDKSAEIKRNSVVFKPDSR
ncbi:tRNA lysidine(34) synthetase TilS [Maridesulfovibrio bastinii]|uniref:tRNA lysidine(34) synthetase TilS n=1 Tax=Maridesulfovibrio bastinii TaxID=47157 RepID=UPI00040AA248|nr:tRNA lysidine(34) synthetase TilS [Maridesulfovibrio bastinii]